MPEPLQQHGTRHALTPYAIRETDGGRTLAGMDLRIFGSDCGTAFISRTFL